MVVKFEQALNISYMLVTLPVSHPERSSEVRPVHLTNIPLMLVTLVVFQPEILIDVMLEQ